MKKAFTLSEVLITLGIIGIVAAMTIPTLIANYQKKQLVAGLQKGYSVLNNVFKMAMAHDSTDYMINTSLFSALPDNTSNPDDYSEFVAELGKYLKIQKYCNPGQQGCFNIEYKLLDGDDSDGEYVKNDRLKVYISDGSIYYFSLCKFGCREIGQRLWLGNIGIDVNGERAPNQNGRDYFDIMLFENGEFLFPGTQYWASFNPVFVTWKTRGCDISVSSSYSGDYCGARIFEEGWKMDY